MMLDDSKLSLLSLICLKELNLLVYLNVLSLKAGESFLRRLRL